VRSTGKPARVGKSGDAPINYSEALAWLYSLQRFGIKLGLENIRRLIAELNLRLGSARASRAVSGALAGNVCELENLTDARCTFGGAPNVAREARALPRLPVPRSK